MLSEQNLPILACVAKNAAGKYRNQWCTKVSEKQCGRRRRLITSGDKNEQVGPLRGRIFAWLFFPRWYTQRYDHWNTEKRRRQRYPGLVDAAALVAEAPGSVPGSRVIHIDSFVQWLEGRTCVACDFAKQTTTHCPRRTVSHLRPNRIDLPSCLFGIDRDRLIRHRTIGIDTLATPDSVLNRASWT